MSKICPKCGRELQDESLFCVNCGQRMDVIEPLTFEPASNVPTESVMPQEAPPEQPQRHGDSRYDFRSSIYRCIYCAHHVFDF